MSDTPTPNLSSSSREITGHSISLIFLPNFTLSEGKSSADLTTPFQAPLQTTTIMSSKDNPGCTVYIGNLDERVSDRVLYDIMIQAGRVLDLHVPRDRETDKPKGFAFAEYESQEIADYAVKLFTGIVVLYNRTLKFAISGQDKNFQNLSMGITSSHRKSRTDPVSVPSGTENLNHSMKKLDSFKASAYPGSNFSSQEPPPPGVTPQSNGYGSRFNDTDYEYSQRVFGSSMDSISRTRSRRYDTSNPIYYPYH